MQIGDIINVEQLIEQAKEYNVTLLAQDNYEERYERTRRALRRLPFLKSKLRNAEDDLRHDRIRRDIEANQRRLDHLYGQLETKKANRQTWNEITELKEEIGRLRGERRFNWKVRTVRCLREDIRKSRGDITVDERRARFDKRPDAYKFAYLLRAKVRKGRNKGHNGRNKGCEVCNEVYKAERSLRFYEKGDVKIGGLI